MGIRLISLCVGAVIATGGLAHGQGDAAEGEKVFRKCQACHMIGEGAKNRVGPMLTGVVGRPIASVEDFRYSDAFVAKKDEGFVWTEETLAAYLADPRGYIPGNRMTFPGLRDEADRLDVIAYLKGSGN